MEADSCVCDSSTGPDLIDLPYNQSTDPPIEEDISSTYGTPAQIIVEDIPDPPVINVSPNRHTDTWLKGISTNLHTDTRFIDISNNHRIGRRRVTPSSNKMLFNKNVANAAIVHEGFENKKPKEKVKNVECVNVNTKEQLSPTSRNDSLKKLKAMDGFEETWAIEEDSDQSDDLSVGPDVHVLAHENKFKREVEKEVPEVGNKFKQEIEKEVPEANKDPIKKLKNLDFDVFKKCSSDEKIVELEESEEFSLPTQKKMKFLPDTLPYFLHDKTYLDSIQNSTKLDSKISNCKFDLEKKYKEYQLKFSELDKEFAQGLNLINNQEYNKNNVSPLISQDSSGPSSSKYSPGPSCSKYSPGPSCSKYSPGPSCSKYLPGPSCSKYSPGPSCSKYSPGPSCSKYLPGPSSSKYLPGPSCAINLTGPSNATNLPGPSNATNLPGPSKATNLPGPSSATNLPGPSNATNLSGPSAMHCSPEFSSLQNEPEIGSQHDLCNKLNQLPGEYNNDKNQVLKAIPLEECNHLKDLSNHMNLNDRNEETQTNDFEEDPDIVNPDIMFNIDLNEHYMQMDSIVQRISKTPDDPTIFDECMQLMPIPQVELRPNQFTPEERLNFMNGVSEWEYEIDSEDWNKIMVKRAVVFTAHAGFSIANEESLYVLADVAIDYIKKLAVIMKKNFDIQAKSSYPDRIYPINNSLQEIGVEGGIKELIKHYENDVFGRRDKLLKKCHHLQKIIDQYVERMQRDPKIKNRNIIKEDLEKKNSMNEQGIIYEENVLSGENKTAIELMTEEDRTEIQMTLEDVGNETQLITEENSYTNTEIEQIEPVYIENSDIEVKEGYPKNIENIKINTLDLGDRKINYKRTTDTKISDLKINLLEPLVVKPYNEILLNTNDCESKNLISLKHLQYLKSQEKEPVEDTEDDEDDDAKDFDGQYKLYKSKPHNKSTTKINRRAKIEYFMRGLKVGHQRFRGTQQKRSDSYKYKAGPSNKK